MPIEIGHLVRLQADVDYCIEQHNKLDDKAFWRRALVRALFGFVECLVFVTRKHFLLHRASIIKDSLLLDHQLVRNVNRLLQATELYETDLMDNGEARIRVRKHRTLPFLKANVRLFFSIFKRQESEAIQLFKTDDWVALEKSIQIRDRLMHPKVNEDIMVTDAEYKLVLRAYCVIVQLMIVGMTSVVGDTKT